MTRQRPIALGKAVPFADGQDGTPVGNMAAWMVGGLGQLSVRRVEWRLDPPHDGSTVGTTVVVLVSMRQATDMRGLLAGRTGRCFPLNYNLLPAHSALPAGKLRTRAGMYHGTAIVVVRPRVLVEPAMTVPASYG
jgi:hypothetical protein